MFDVESYLTSQVASVTVSGDERIIDCPNTDCGKAKRFYVHVGGERNCHFICYSCNVRGRTSIELMVVVEGITRAEALRRAMRGLTGTTHRTATPVSLLDTLAKLRAPVVDPLVDVALPDEYVALTKRGGRVVETPYTKKRGITPAAIARFKMGVCAQGRYFGRLILPFDCPNGRSFTARDYTGKSQVRYLNPRKDEDGAQHNRLVYGWPEGDEWEEGGELFVVEGPLDRVRMWQHGFPAIATMGKALHDAKLDLIFNHLKPASLVVLLDPEEDVAAVQMAKTLSSGVDRVWIARLPVDDDDGEKVDPGNSTFAQVSAAYRTAERFTGSRGPLLDAMLRSLVGK